MKKEYQNRSGEYEKSYGGSSYNKDERSHYTSRKEDTKPPKIKNEGTKPPKDSGNVSEVPSTSQTQGTKRMKTIYKKLFLIWFFVFLLSNVFVWIMNDDSSDEDVQSEETLDDPWGWDDMEDEQEPVPNATDEAANAANAAASDSPESETESSAIAPKDKDSSAPTNKDESVSDDDLTTLEDLERRNHAEVVKEAQRVGVSTEGTTLEILERINHAEVVKEAQRIGVSTEGTTLEILERINHAEVVKEAQRIGVSTEGTTLEIMERINRKEMEDMK